LLLALFPAVLVASLMLVSGAQAAAGDPDPTFSTDGKQRTDFGAGPSAAAAVVRQADGNVVAVGEADDNFLVARYNLDGSLDPSFSGDGRVQTNLTGVDGATDVALRGKKIVAVGSGGGHFALARYNPNGTLDPSFSGDGKQTTDFGFGGGDAATGVAIQDDGKIVVVGFAAGPMSSSAFALARYNPNGTLDPTFSGDGKQTIYFLGSDKAFGVALQSDGKIVVVGSGVDNAVTGASEGALARYNPNGTLDTSFSGDGTQTTDFLFGAADVANDVAIQANGRIFAVGFAGGGATGDDFALARYKTDGSLDPGFSGDGLKRTSFGGSDRANGVALQGDGRIVAAGVGNGEFALARYLGG
jgi:uncharacterized delta-60 repeat protein